MQKNDNIELGQTQENAVEEIKKYAEKFIKLIVDKKKGES